MARLSIPDQPTSAEFTVTTPTTAFPISFSLFAKADLTVLVDGSDIGQGSFTFAGTLLEGGGYAGGTVTLNSAVDDVTVRIERNVTAARTSNFAPANSTPVSSVDQALNRVTAIQQDHDRRIRATEGVVIDADAVAASAEVAVAARIEAVAAAARAGGIIYTTDEGAVGDGITDDTAEISSLMAANPGRLLFGTGRTFKVSSNLPAGFSLIDGQIVDTRMVTAADDFGVIGLGFNALAANTYIPEVHAASGGRFFASGNCIVAIGYRAMQANTTGRRMVAYGYRSLLSNTTGYYNSGLGSHTLESCTTGYQNLAAGTQALQALTTGHDNVGLGNGSGVALGTGSRNTFGGSESGRGVTNGDDNAFWGYQAGGGLSAGGLSQSVAIGAYALKTATGNANSMGGFRAGQDITSGARNTGWGKDALVSLTTGQDCVGIGNQAAQNVTTNSFVTSVGSYSLAFCSAAGATAFGYQAAYALTTGTGVTAGGYNALRSVTTNSNSTAWGSQCLELATGPNNTGVGRAAGISLTSGGSNTFIGESAGASETTGDQNTAVGKGANGNGNGYSNTTSIGCQAEPTGSNQVTLGNASISALRCAQTTITAISDARWKEAANDDGRLSAEQSLALVRGVTIRDFRWNEKAGARLGQREAGVYAQELYAAANSAGLGWMGLATKGDADRPWEATPGKMIFPMIVAQQHTLNEIDTLRERVRVLEDQLAIAA